MFLDVPRCPLWSNATSSSDGIFCLFWWPTFNLSKLGWVLKGCPTNPNSHEIDLLYAPNTLCVGRGLRMKSTTRPLQLSGSVRHLVKSALWCVGGWEHRNRPVSCYYTQALPNRFNLYCACCQSSFSIHLGSNVPAAPPPCKVFST